MNDYLDLIEQEGLLTTFEDEEEKSPKEKDTETEEIKK